MGTPGGGQDMEPLLGVVGDSSLPESDVQSSSSEEWMPRWCDLRWCFTMVVFRQKLFRHPSWAHLYGRLPVWILLCLARDEDCLLKSVSLSSWASPFITGETYI